MEQGAASARERKRQRQGNTAAAPPGEPHYNYQSITDALKHRYRRVSLFAAVAHIGPSRLSKGTDWTATLRVLDESRKAGISVTFFAKERGQLPCVKSIRDVISLHNVEINNYMESSLKFNKNFSSFALFESKVSAECSPYQTSMTYHGSKQDKEHLTHMRAWLPQVPKDFGLKDLELQLRSLKSDYTFDLVCQVWHVCENRGKWIFYVWDGTDTPAAEFQAISDAEAVVEPPLPLEVLRTMPCVGTVLRIFSDSPIKQQFHTEKGPYWARFCNITCKQEFGIWIGDLSKSSMIRLLSHEDDSVVDRLKMYDSRKANKVHRQPMASFPSNVADEYEKKGYSTLMESLTYGEVTHKVKTLVRVVGFYPSKACELSLLLPLTRDYSIRLTLEDPTTRIYAYLHKDNLAKFFDGFPTVEVFIKKMNKLLGVPEPEDGEEVVPLTLNPPLIWCALQSYYQEKNDPWGSRRYRIVDTTIRH